MGEKQNLDFSQTLNFLNAVLQKSQSFTQHMDNQISILIGLSTAISAFFASQLKNSGGQGSLPLVILTVFPLLSAVTGLFAVHPPRFMRKRNQPESLMYNKKVIGFASAEEYARELEKTTLSQKEVLEQYAEEIYNLSKYYYRPKRDLFHLSRNILIIGFLASLVVFILELTIAF